MRPRVGARNNVRGERAINSEQYVVIRAGTASPLVCFSRRGGSIGRGANLHLARPRRRSPRIRHRSQARYHPRPSIPPCITCLITEPHPPTPLLLQIVIDAICVLVDLGYSLLHSECEPGGGVESDPAWLEVLSLISTGITTFFLVEIPLTLWSLGSEFYNPLGRIPHASLHIFDAVIIVTTFVLEVILKGRERELAGLLIILRLWRLLKLVGGE